MIKYLPAIFYILGSLCFIVGTVVGMVLTRNAS